MTKFILIFPNSTTAQQLAVKSLFPPVRADWWHWSSDVWLLSFKQEVLTAQILRDEVKRLVPGVYFLVFEVKQRADVAGWGPSSWQEWINQFWK
jgi:hypothetical protein